ncbi:ACT domain-containing protein [Clostridium estertheticum]|uniref:ACT domain-containing protein n=1 Tax=Clostridium estertheticum TaxID=238834 RepID=UPI001C0D11B1|nr:ACT domain-containing protein [Clostridium estertheticum]MBU3174868.1 ACT domain-containing protein [Clostridium estertheticum]
MSEKILTMKLLNEKFAVCRLNKNESMPEWVKNSSFYSITKTSDELSIVCSQDSIPSNIKCEKDWRILKVEGPLDFSLIGIISSISTILALKRISIFAVSTYDTDYILVKNKDIDNTILALSNEKYEIINQENLL